jgi:hypothetical protein
VIVIVQVVGKVTVAFDHVSALYTAAYDVSPVVVVVVVLVVEAEELPLLQLARTKVEVSSPADRRENANEDFVRRIDMVVLTLLSLSR